MNAEELAQAMLDWGRQKRALDELGEKIQAAVLELGKTQTVGSVRASYSAGRKKYDYHKAWFNVYSVASAERIIDLQNLIRKYTEPVTNWRAVCKEGDVKDVPFTQGEPSVSLKLTE